MYGTFYDIPARAFFDIQVDLDYRKEWDHLLIEVEVVDKDEESDCEVVKWIQHFPVRAIPVPLCVLCFDLNLEQEHPVSPSKPEIH